MSTVSCECSASVLAASSADSRLRDIDLYDNLVDVLQRINPHPAAEVHAPIPRLYKVHFAADSLRSDHQNRRGRATAPRTDRIRRPRTLEGPTTARPETPAPHRGAPVLFGEAPVDLEVLQQDRNADPTSVGAIGQQSLLRLEHGPVLGELPLGPASFHPKNRS